MSNLENKKDDIRTCHTFDEKESQITINLQDEDQKGREYNLVEDFTDKIEFHIFKDNSIVFLDFDQSNQNPFLIYCYPNSLHQDIQRKNSLQIDQKNNSNFIQNLFTKKEYKYQLQNFSKYYGNVELNLNTNKHLFYGRTVDDKLLFEFVEFNIQNQQQEQNSQSSFQIEKIQTSKIIDSINKKDNVNKVIMADNLNFGLILYTNGALSIVQPVQNSTGNQQLIVQQWKEILLCKKQIDEILLINQNNYKADLLWTSKLGIFIQKDIDFFNVKNLQLEQSHCLLGGQFQYLSYDQKYSDIYFIEKKMQKEKAIYSLNQISLQENKKNFQLKLDGPCLKMKRNKRHAFVIIEKTMKNQEQKDSIQVLRIYDMQNKYLAFNYKKFNLTIFNFQFYNSGALFIINSSKQKKQIIDIKEDSDQEKFEKFRKRRFFELAANFAENKNKPILKYQIYKEAGDYYFKDGQYDQAVQFYIQTIGALEQSPQDNDEFQPSFIIKNFLKSTLLQHITKYLEALHQNKKNLANLYDTSLLISIYLKQEKEQEIEQFFENYQFKNKEKINKAIDLCLESQKFELAKKIAKQNNFNQKYLEISVENNFFGELNSEQAKVEAKNILMYLDKISYTEFQHSIKQLGYILYPHQPQMTFEIILAKITDNLKANQQQFSIACYLDIFQNFEEVYQFPQTELFVDFVFKNLNQFINEKKQAATFVINYLVFSYIKLANRQQNDDQKINQQFEDQKKNIGDKINKFINSNDTRIVNESYLILLFSEPGLLQFKQNFMYRNGKKIDLVNLYFDNKEYDKCCDLCSANKEDVDLPIHFLKLICEMNQTSQEIESDKSPNKYIPKLLDLIEQKNQYSPLFLIKFLKKNKYLKIKDIKQYYKNLLNNYQQRIQQIKEDQQGNQKKLISQKQKLLDLKKNPRYFQFTICQFCKENTNQPTIYFFCGHFYHKNCIEKNQCQECDMIQRDKIEQREQFKNEDIQIKDIHPFDYENCIDVFGKASF